MNNRNGSYRITWQCETKKSIRKFSPNNLNLHIYLYYTLKNADLYIFNINYVALSLILKTGESRFRQTLLQILFIGTRCLADCWNATSGTMISI